MTQKAFYNGIPDLRLFFVGIWGGLKSGVLPHSHIGSDTVYSQDNIHFSSFIFDML